MTRTIRLYLITVFCFYFQKLVFGNIKKKQIFCIFEIKNVFGYLKLKKKKKFFEEKKKKILKYVVTRICTLVLTH